MIMGRIRSAPDVDAFAGDGAGRSAVTDESSGACIVMTESDMASSSMLVSGESPECVSVSWGTAESSLGPNADGVRSSGLSYGSVGSGVASGSDRDISLSSVGVEGVLDDMRLIVMSLASGPSSDDEGLKGSPSGRSCIGGSRERPSVKLSKIRIARVATYRRQSYGL
jgi:hypothetical protein